MSARTRAVVGAAGGTNTRGLEWSWSGAEGAATPRARSGVLARSTRRTSLRVAPEPLWDHLDLQPAGGEPGRPKKKGGRGGRPPSDDPIFLDPSGRRWRRLRGTGVAALLLVVVALVLAVPRLYDTPALATFGEPLGPNLTSAETGLKAPLVGTGPLVRVLKVERSAGAVTGVDPFTGKTEATFTLAEVAKLGSAPYVMQRFGYSAAAKKTISITFDDGPDPRWTPELLDLLAAEKVPATFFATGTMIAEHPEIFQREVREGHAVANHSLTHTDMSTATSWRARLELTATDHVIRAVTGQEVGYFRLPYEGSDDASTQATINGIMRSQRHGYVVTSHDFDTDDWAYSSGQAPGEIPLPTLDGSNVTMLMHDGGGEGRQLTLDYVRKLIPYARAQGYTFQTMPQVQPWLAERVVAVDPTVWDKAVLGLVRAFVVWPSALVKAMFAVAVASVVLLGGTYLLLAWARRRRRQREFASVSSAARAAAYTRLHAVEEHPIKRVSVLIAAYNEEEVIARTLDSVLGSTYPFLELIVVNDGSSDDTAAEVGQVWLRDPRIVPVDQANTGKSEALNHGLRRARGDIIVTLDADTILQPDAIENLVRHFDCEGSERLGAVAGVLRVANRERNLLTRWQALEYLTQIGVERAAQDAMGAISIVPGALAAWRKEAILEVGGYSHVTLAEDCDLALSLHKAGWKIRQDDDAVAYTEAPETVDALLSQRTRWVFGTFQALWKHRDMMFRRRYGLLGWFVLPNYVLSILVPLLFLPLVVFLGIQTAQHGGLLVLLTYFSIFLTAHFLTAAAGVALMGERWRHLLMVPIYRIVYEPLRAYLLYTSVYKAVKGVRAGWNKLARTGEMDAELSVPKPAQQPALTTASAA